MATKLDALMEASEGVPEEETQENKAGTLHSAVGVMPTRAWELS